ncbi:MAG: hypothetical protein ACFFE8_14055 [Candidatus Heimdallarchaeota archaeon]
MSSLITLETNDPNTWVPHNDKFILGYTAVLVHVMSESVSAVFISQKMDSKTSNLLMKNCEISSIPVKVLPSVKDTENAEPLNELLTMAFETGAFAVLKEQTVK